MGGLLTGLGLTIVWSRMQCSLGVGSQGKGVRVSLKAGGESGWEKERERLCV